MVHSQVAHDHSLGAGKWQSWSATCPVHPAGWTFLTQLVAPSHEIQRQEEVSGEQRLLVQQEMFVQPLVSLEQREEARRRGAPAGRWPRPGPTSRRDARPVCPCLRRTTPPIRAEARIPRMIRACSERARSAPPDGALRGRPGASRWRWTQRYSLVQFNGECAIDVGNTLPARSLL